MAGFKYVRRSAESWEKKASQRGSSRDSFLRDEYRLYQVRKGENSIRILPPTWEGADDYGLQIYVHYGVGPDNASVICPRSRPPVYMDKTAGEYTPLWDTGPCPICEAQQRARDARNDEEASNLAPRRRVLVWLLDRKDERQGVQAWALPWTLDRDIGKMAKDRHTGEWWSLDDPTEGYDVYIDREEQGQGFPSYRVVQKSSSPTTVAEEHLTWIQSNPLPETLILRDYEAISKIFKGTVYQPNQPKPEARPETTNGHREPERSATPEQTTQPFEGGQRFGRPQTRDPEPEPETPPPTAAEASGQAKAMSLRERMMQRNARQ